MEVSLSSFITLPIDFLLLGRFDYKSLCHRRRFDRLAHNFERELKSLASRGSFGSESLLQSPRELPRPAVRQHRQLGSGAFASVYLVNPVIATLLCENVCSVAQTF